MLAVFDLSETDALYDAYDAKWSAIMCRSLMFLMVSLLATVADGEDYLLSLDTVGYSNVPATQNNPAEALLRSVEVVVSPGRAFSSRTKIGNQMITLAGDMQRARGGKFRVNIRYSTAIDTGRTLPLGNGQVAPSLEKDAMQTTMLLAEGEAFRVGGGVSFSGPNSNASHEKSKTQVVVRLAKYLPEKQNALTRIGPPLMSLRGLRSPSLGAAPNANGNLKVPRQ